MERLTSTLSSEQRDHLLSMLRNRFAAHIHRHKDIKWENIQKRLMDCPEKLWSLNQMELSGGEPDVIGYDQNDDTYLFIDCSVESPVGRRNLCYDHPAWEKRKDNKPPGNAIDLAATMGIELLTEQEYRELQKLGNFDTKPSSWIKTP